MSSSSSTSSLSSLSSNSSNYYKPKVALIGSGGLLGDATLTAFLSSEFSDYFAKPIRVITRNMDQPLPEHATFLRVDWDDDNVEEHLTRCLRGVSIVVNLLGYNPDAWDIVTRAACRVKPQLYIPPEFSFDHTVWDPRRIPIGSVVDDKRRQTEMARAAGIRTVQIFCGMIMENIISGPHTGVDFSARRRVMAVSTDSGSESAISFTSSWDVGRAIAAISTMPAGVLRGELDQVYISGDTSSWSKIAKLMNAQVTYVGASTFESQYIDHSSPIESFIRIAAADGQLHFPAQQSSRSRRGAPLNHNHLVDSMATKGWVKLSQVVRHFDKHEDNITQPGTSSPEDSSKATAFNKRKRDGSDSASVESNGSVADGKRALDENEQETPLERTADEETRETRSEAPATSAKPKNYQPRSSNANNTARSRRKRGRPTAAAAPAAANPKTATTATTTQPVAAFLLEKRVTRSMTKHQASPISTKNDRLETKNGALTGRNKRRRVG
ncbi:hypothetical protein H072_5074 [Dactylellina haptotyla CBS 200.50]|uniref:NmrA-like domain-containing protein n=1 Tax=Dactylellina haptotyla (strain CBS 200.50) TaxID=1284197 RepID=S8ADF3_DACHA|nr:hypothetical protein H072_5074 [Dactylellina haptotyla CBS 200.50]